MVPQRIVQSALAFYSPQDIQIVVLLQQMLHAIECRLFWVPTFGEILEPSFIELCLAHAWHMRTAASRGLDMDQRLPLYTITSVCLFGAGVNSRYPIRLNRTMGFVWTVVIYSLIEMQLTR